jgi:hypothetical protein
MSVITLGSRSFAGPFMAPLWSAPKAAGLYAVMAPGWRLLTWRALDFDHAVELSAQHLLKHHRKYPEWLRIVGSEWNLYVATHEMPFSSAGERESALRAVVREYRPEFKPMVSPEAPSMKTMLLAQAMRTNKDN